MVFNSPFDNVSLSNGLNVTFFQLFVRATSVLWEL